MITAIFRVISQQLQGALTIAFEKHFTVEDFTKMDQNMCKSIMDQHTCKRYVQQNSF